MTSSSQTKKIKLGKDKITIYIIAYTRSEERRGGKEC